MNISSKVYSKRHVRRKRKLEVEIQMQRFDLGSQEIAPEILAKQSVKQDKHTEASEEAFSDTNTTNSAEPSNNCSKQQEFAYVNAPDEALTNQATCSEDENIIPSDNYTGSVRDLSSEEECNYNENTLREFICQWTSGHKIPHNAVSELLQHLKTYKEFSSLPRDARTILKTPRSTDVKIISPGKYVHFGIENNLIRILDEGLKSPVKSDWKTYSARVMHQFQSFEEGKRNIGHFEEFSELSGNETGCAKQKSGSGRKVTKRKLEFADESSDEDALKIPTKFQVEIWRKQSPQGTY
ncbi:unnamed protein product [Allacma fusca]|uniref:Uncharacterized protein n=1 Tax=Allacma fusca TaxID=39272 RepID=A0A8J2JYR0_9HEXA|nr:unnamed protein product [Allacma fusca]